MPTNKVFIERALRAWFSYAPDKSRFPTPSATTVETYDDLMYVVLRSGKTVIDIFRYIPSEGQLRLLREKWPGPYGRRSKQKAAAA
jgi:hypothetical protein